MMARDVGSVAVPLWHVGSLDRPAHSCVRVRVKAMQSVEHLGSSTVGTPRTTVEYSTACITVVLENRRAGNQTRAWLFRLGIAGRLGRACIAPGSVPHQCCQRLVWTGGNGSVGSIVGPTWHTRDRYVRNLFEEKQSMSTKSNLVGSVPAVALSNARSSGHGAVPTAVQAPEPRRGC